MALVINSNIASLQAQKNLTNTQNSQASTFQRLSTGLRINSAKDDAGGLFLAESQTKDIRGLNMATRNAGDGISMAQTAEGALDQIGKNLQRVNELAIQSANGTYSAEARAGLQKETDQLTQEINRIVETTEFNGNKLLSKDSNAETLQISFDNNSGSRIKTGLEGGIVNQSGIKDVTFSGAGKSFALSEGGSDALTASGGTTSLEIQNTFAETVGITKHASTGLAGATVEDGELKTEINAALKEFQGNSATLADAMVKKFGEATEGEIKFTAKGMDFTLSGKAVGATGVATFAAAKSYAEYDGTTVALGATVVGAKTDFTDEGASITSMAITNAYSGEVDTSVANTPDFSGADVGVKVADANALGSIIEGGLNGTLTIDISSQASAQSSITSTRNAIDMVSELRAGFGASMNRFESVISGNQTYTENLSSARSRVQDADFAVETANLAKLQVLQQAGTSILGQANASGQSVLGLL